MKINEFQQNFLKGVSYCSKSSSKLLEEEYDVAIFSASWDKRCLSVTNCNDFRSGFNIVIYPTIKDDYGLREKHDKKLEEFTNRLGNSTPIIEDISDPEKIWKIVFSHVEKIHSEIGRPLRVFVDLSTTIRYVTLGLLGKGMKMGMFEKISIFYAEGKYPKEEKPEDQYEMFTKGIWNVLRIPGFEGTWNSFKDRFYLVSVGFEGTKTLRLIARDEPDHVKILFPDPGVKDEYVNRAKDRNQALFDKFNILDEDILRANAGDAIDGWSKLSEANIEDSFKHNFYYLCCGTKAHSLSLALRALTLDFPILVYINPEQHRVAKIEALGIYWRYDITDISAI